MSLILWKLVMVCLPGAYIALRWLPLSCPGRYALCLGFGGISALIATAAIMWWMLVFLGLILPWVPVLVLSLLALFAEALARFFPSRAQPLSKPAESSPLAALTPGEKAFVAFFAALIVIRLLSLLPDVLLRPLFAWDAWTVWGFEARVWLEAGTHVEFLSRSEWLTAPGDVYLREGLIAYPGLIPALILWAAAGAEAWTGVGPGILWFAAAGFMALIIFGTLRQAGSKLTWAMAAAYAFISVPLVNAHVALYGYADLWIGALISIFAAMLVLAGLGRPRLWYGLACLALVPLPFIKVEGLYWVIMGSAALILAWRGMRLRTVMALVAAGFGVALALKILGIDLVVFLTQGRLSLASDGSVEAFKGAARHAFYWFDWHLFVYLALLVFALLVVRPGLGSRVSTLSVFSLLGMVLLWVVAPTTEAGSFLSVGTLFSRLLLHLFPALLLLCVIIVEQWVVQADDDRGLGSGTIG